MDDRTDAEIVVAFLDEFTKHFGPPKEVIVRKDGKETEMHGEKLRKLAMKSINGK